MQSSAFSDRHKLTIFRQVRRQEIVKYLVHLHGDLEMHTLADWKLMYVAAAGRA